MATKKAAKKKTSRKKTKTLVDDPPILVGGGGSTLTAETFVRLPKGTPKVDTTDTYDVYRVAYDVQTIVTKRKKNGSERKTTPENDTWGTVFSKSKL